MTLDDRVFLVKLFRLALKFIAMMERDRELGIPCERSLGQGFKEETEKLLIESK